MYVAQESSTKHHTLAEKQALIAEIERRVKADGRGVKPVARQLGIAAGSYYRWLREGVRPTASPAARPGRDVEVLAPGKPGPAVAPTTGEAHERARLMAAVRAGLAHGVPIKITARQHGITEAIFYRWAREAGRGPVRKPVRESAPSQALVVSPPQTPAFRAVTLGAPEPARALCLVAPSGHRIEGLSVETAAALLRALS